ncbi:MAG: hypothetical protein C7B44_13485 [Sulfobacillus thermosulfidooxidans]|uniref:Uncharacterized protein n=1 Tax=Sulfobacillus thermotolerans TaxID=338644 RepID=A0ABN5H1U7_9FIRM|nr:hypothetical protein [Sulfobacillus sp. hq2]AUW93849.1 hypothetical protein BXT84_07750 [Sulfobacillus thermotolerans]MCY0908920.1 hypothetical protein [Sulfobacillus thermotolerans]POB11337.1 hypothetical protein CO251_05345 [Sulfobacillus sp. hq2]PSR35401.1 MAG: hypothetical protein C7B44_13485 [Sulfobacillus thermosulfidooxidans]
MTRRRCANCGQWINEPEWTKAGQESRPTVYWCLPCRLQVQRECQLQLWDQLGTKSATDSLLQQVVREWLSP